MGVVRFSEFDRLARQGRWDGRDRTDRAHVMVLLLVAETAPTSPINPGLGATVPTPPAAVLIAGWVLGIVTLAVLWAASRR